jgi:hypothetical protein
MVVLEGAFLVSPALTDWTTGQRPSQARAPSTAVTHERVDPPRSWDDLEVFEDYLRGPESRTVPRARKAAVPAKHPLRRRD